MTGRLPDFIIVGAMKGGTTSLAHYLAEHPDVYMPDEEVHFFDRDDRWRAGPDRYRAFFAEAGGERRVGEKTPSYAFRVNLQPPVPDRIADLLPDAQLVWSLRNPVDRAYSDYWHRVSHGKERDAFETALERETRRGKRPVSWFVERGFYAQQIEAYLRRFPREQMHFIVSEAMFDDTPSVLRDVYAFLGVDPSFTGCRTGEVRHERSRIPRLRGVQTAVRRVVEPWSPTLRRRLQRFNERFARPRPRLAGATRARLDDHFRPHNRRLADLLDVDLARWGWAT